MTEGARSAGRVTIGEFATITRLSRKALRLYHQLGLLEPASVDAATGYRWYDAGQIGTARLIRRFRDLGMPVAEVQAYVAADDDAARAAVLAAHLGRLEAQLEQTRDAVAALRALVSTPAPELRLDVRHLAPVPAVAVTATVRLADVVGWWTAASADLDAVLRAAGVEPTGPLGGLYDHALFADEEGEVTVWLPVPGPVPVTGRVRSTAVPGGWFAVAVHDGPDSRLDETYAALGGAVAARGIGADGPVREHYLAGVLGDPRPLVTEIAWPVTGPG